MKYHKSSIGEYQIERTLESSQYSVLCLGKKPPAGPLVRLRLWLTAQADSEERRTRIHEEVAALQAIEHPHLLPLLEVQTDRQKVFLASAYTSAGSLAERLEQSTSEAFPLADALQIIQQVGQALQELHARGITHGNLTPQAVFFDETGQVRLGEYVIRGILVSIQHYQPMLDENVPRCFYMAPEQFRGKTDAQTDQYALGCLAYQLLTGQVPFSGAARATLSQRHQRDQPLALTAINPALPGYIEEAILIALAKNPRNRYDSVQAFLDALDESNAHGEPQEQLFPLISLNRMGGPRKIWKWDVTLPLWALSGDANSSSRAGHSAYPSLPGSISQMFPSAWSARPARQRMQSILFPVTLLALILLLVAGRWLFFPGRSNTIRPEGNMHRIASATSVQTSVAAITVQPLKSTATPTLTSTPRPSLTPTPMPTPRATPVPAQVQISLTSFFNNEGIGRFPGQADFDGSGYAYPADQLPSGGQITVQGVVYQFPSSASGANDNITASGQTIPLVQNKYRQVFFLAAASWGPVTGVVTIRYADGSTSSITITVRDWYTGPANGLSTDNRYSPDGVDHNAVYIYVISLTLDATRVASALLLPGSQSGPYRDGHIHIFSLTLLH